MSEEERPRVDRAIRRADEQRRALDVDVRVTGPRHHVRWLRLRATPTGADGPPVFDATLTHVTHHKLVSRRLELFEAVSVHARDAIVVTEASFKAPGPRVVYVNDSFTRITGYEAHEIIGESPRLLQGPGTDPATTAMLRTHFERWRPAEATVLNYRRDGTPFWNELGIVPVADGTGWYTHWIAIQRDVTERRRMQERVTFLAYHDELTRLHNRAAFKDRLRAACTRGGDEPFALVHVDLDRFKAINDRLGHGVGDIVLQEVARRLESCARASDVAARLGGDEFVLLVDRITSVADARSVARRVREAITAPFFRDGRPVPMGASVGVAIFPIDGDDPGSLTSAADLALYEAKGREGTGVAFFDERLRTRLMEAGRIEEELREGLARHEFELHLQPQWRLADETVVGVECLLRWRHPTRGCLPPAAFLEVAEQRGLMGPLQGQVLDLVVATAARLRAGGWRTGPLALNLTVCELGEPGFATRFLGRLAAVGLDPQDLAVEVVERVFLDDNRATIVDNLRALHEHGIAVELDDFGTGFASLTHLRSFPIDRVKIDQSFVADLGADPQDATIVRAIIDLAHNLGMTCVAEGVETEAQRARLARWGCDAAQGYLRAAPMAEAELTAWLAARTAESRDPA
jgi:diguanylate cyclase (GGDEF)-like protein/PAS domain S-box-containing protein